MPTSRRGWPRNRPSACPTITFDGADDGVRPPADASAHARRFTGPRSHRVVPGVGHNMPQEAPRVFADAVLELVPASQDMTDSLKTLSEHRCFGGVQRFHEHDSREIGLPMRFSVFLPPQAGTAPVPALYVSRRPDLQRGNLHGQGRRAARGGRTRPALIAPDTSPRGRRPRHPRRDASWDFGVGAGFYLDATEAPWAEHWRMES